MTRFWAIPTLAFLTFAVALAHAGDKKIELDVKGVLSKDDAKEPPRGTPSKAHVVAMKAGTVYTIDMISPNFDSFLVLLDPKGNKLDEDDDGGGNLNSKIVFNCSKDGDYKIIATSLGGNGQGNFTLQVKNGGPVQKVATGHTQMLTKPAPDFTPDFAVNGKPGKLADFKDKVVLLYFWEPRSTSAAALLPNLAAWNKAHKADGLAIVGVTFYPSEIGQKLEWDAENERVKTAKKADRKSDQALLGVFAKHHKIDHQLIALTKADALATFDAYVVNSLPQVVLIDRKGMVRLIDIQGEKGAANVETEIKKLLAEK